MMLLVVAIAEAQGDVSVTFRRVDLDNATGKEFAMAAEVQRGASERLRALAGRGLGSLAEMTPEEVEAAGLPPVDEGEGER